MVDEAAFPDVSSGYKGICLILRCTLVLSGILYLYSVSLYNKKVSEKRLHAWPLLTGPWNTSLQASLNLEHFLPLSTTS